MNTLSYTLATLFVLGSAHGALAAPIASAGFNDASGIHSDGVADSPYELGAVINGQGAGEPGWNGPWGGGGNLNTVQSAIVFEGDGAAKLNPGTGTSRVLALQQAGRFVVEQHVRIDAGSQGTIYADQSAPEGEAFQGPIWQIRSDGNFRVIDGTGNACIVCPGENTGFTWVPDTWYKVAISVDMNSQTWEFFVDDQKYSAPDPLGFRGTPLFVDRVRYQFAGSGAVYLDKLVVAPEPSALALAGLGVLGVVTFTRRRKML